MEKNEQTNSLLEFGDSIRKMRYAFMIKRLVQAVKNADDEWTKIFDCTYCDPRGEEFILKRGRP